jgi:hypothetical protein
MVKNNSLPAFMTVSVRDIAKRAYEMYLQHGRADESDHREDWRRAERELQAPGTRTRDF